MKFLFLIVAFVAFVNADHHRSKCIEECGVDPYLVKRVEDFHDFQYENEKIKKYVLCDMKERGIIIPAHSLDDEIHRLQGVIKGKHEYDSVEVCKHMSGHTYEELAWNMAKCMNYKHKSRHVTVAMACGDKFGISKKLIDEMVEHHKKISTKGDKKKDFYFCYFEKMGWMNAEGKISKTACVNSFKKGDQRGEQYGRYIEECKHSYTVSWDIIKCFVDKIH